MFERWLGETYGIEARNVVLLRRGGSAVYDVDADEGRFILRVVTPAFADTARQSARIQAFLFAHGVCVPRVICALDGALTREADGETRMLTEYVRGEEPRLDGNTGEMERAEEIGATAARMRGVMRGYPEKLVRRDKAFFIDRYVRLLEKKGCAEALIARYRARGDELWARVEGQEAEFCHGDLHRGNLLAAPGGRITVLDFDTACMAPPMFDVMVLCDSTNYFAFEEAGRVRALHTRDAFLKGYLREETLGTREIDSFCDWIAIRHFQLQATILEIYGLDCVDEAFVERQMDWLDRWRAQE